MTQIEELIEAAKTGDERRVRTLIEAKPELLSARLPSGESPLMAALYRGHTHIAAVLIDLGAELDVFASAATGNLAGLKHALARPDQVHAYAYDGWTALHLAAFFGQLEAARMLVEAGADPNAASRNSLKNTPLHAAAAGRQEPVAILLLESGADPEAVDVGGYTVVRIAEENKLSALLTAMRTRRA